MADFEQIATGTLSSTANDIDITAIPSTFKHLELWLNLHSDADLTDVTLKLRFNGITSNDYAIGSIYSNDGGTWSYFNDGFSWVDYLQIGEAPGLYGTSSGNRDPNDTCNVVIRVFDYASTSLTKVCHVETHSPFPIAGGNSAGSHMSIATGGINTTSAISSILVYPSTTPFSARCRYWLSGWK